MIKMLRENCSGLPTLYTLPLSTSDRGMQVLSDSKEQQTHNRMSAMYESTHRGDVKNEPYQEQNHGSVACLTTKTMKEGEIAPLDAL
jgi:hypothetical protein